MATTPPDDLPPEMPVPGAPDEVPPIDAPPSVPLPADEIGPMGAPIMTSIKVT